MSSLSVDYYNLNCFLILPIAVFQRSGEILKLPFEVKSFRDELKPRSRFKNTDIPSMRRKLTTLSKRLDETRHKKLPNDRTTLRLNDEVDADQVGITNEAKVSFLKDTHLASLNKDEMVPVRKNTEESDLEKYTTHVKLKKLRRRLNVNLVKHYNPTTHTPPIHQKLQGSRLSKNNPFVKKVEGRKSSVLSSYEKDMTVNRILPSI